MIRPTRKTNVRAFSSSYLLATLAALVATACSQPSSRHTDPETEQFAQFQLRYEQPAEHFEETLLLGNGRVGASLFGGVETERIYLNDATLWAGGPVDASVKSTRSGATPASGVPLK